MELVEPEEEQYDFEDDASWKFSSTEEQTSTSKLFTNFEKRDINLLRAVIKNSDDVSDHQNVQLKKVKLDVLDSDLPDESTSEKKFPSAISAHSQISRYRHYSEIQDDDDNLDVEPFDDAQWVRDEATELSGEELTDFKSGMRFTSLLNHLTALPDIEDISSSLSEDTATPSQEIEIDYSLIGKFVDPITGLEILEPAPTNDDFEDDFVDMEEFGEYEKEELTAYMDVTEDSELLELQELDAAMEQEEETKLAQAVEEDDMIELELAKQITTTTDLNFKQVLVEDTRQQNEAIVSAFVEELIQLVVGAAQYKDPKEVLRKSIDKRKLMDHINQKLRELEMEQSMRLYLNRKIVDHHKRKRFYRAIIEDSPETVEYFMAKYQEQLQRYDEIMGKEGELKILTTAKTDKLNEILTEKRRRYEDKVNEFEELVRKSLLPNPDATETKREVTNRATKDKNQDYIRNINILLNKLTTSRKEISKSRLALIKKQHLFTELKEELNRVQNLGNGLHLVQFENLQNEVTQLSKKTEERNTELTKARLQRQLDIHISTHMKERTIMLRDTLAVQTSSYQTLLEECDETRRRLYKQKMIRSNIRKEAKEYDFQGGILSRPALMLDYDHTVEEVKGKEEIVKGLRNQYKKINEKIIQYEQLLKSGFQNKISTEF